MQNHVQSIALASALLLILVFSGAYTGFWIGEQIESIRSETVVSIQPLRVRAAWLGGVGATIVALGAMAAGFIRGDSAVLRMAQARAVDEAEARQVGNIVAEIAVASGMPTPKVVIVDDTYPNAFATGLTPEAATIGVTTGLLALLNREETLGVIGHEMAHIHNRDVEFSTLLAAWLGVLFGIREASRRAIDSSMTGGVMTDPVTGRKQSYRGGVALFWVTWTASAVLSVVAWVVVLAASRRREVVADMFSVQWTRNPEALASALEKIGEYTGVSIRASRGIQHLYFNNPFRVHELDSIALLSTHPPLQSRIRLLRAMAGADSG